MENDKEIKEIKIDSKIKSFNFDDVISDEFSYIHLQTTSNCLIGQINKLLIDDSTMIIVDKTISKTVFIYDLNGKFKNKISKRGKGPGEFIEIQDVALSKTDKKIVLVDLMTKRINTYDYNGLFLVSYPLNCYMYTIAVIDSNTLAFDSKNYGSSEKNMNNFRFFTGLFNGQLISRGFQYNNDEHKKFTWDVQQNLWEFDRNVFYNPPFTDTIYAVTKDTLIKAYFLNMLGKNISSFGNEVLTNERFKEIKNSCGFLNGDFIELKDFIYLSLLFGEKIYHTFYSKKTEHVLSGITGNTLNPFLAFYSIPIARYNDNSILVKMNANDVLKYKFMLDSPGMKNQTNEVRKAFEGIFENVNENDNPVLFRYTLKDF